MPLPNPLESGPPPRAVGPAAERASRYSIGLAEPSDDAALRALLRRNAMEGAISLTFEREPSYFAAARLQGDFCQTVVARENGALIGMGTRAVGPGFLNGEARPVGYLGDLKLERAHRGGTLIARGYRHFRFLHQDGRAPLYCTVIVADNERALSTIAARRAGLPGYHDQGLLLCPALHLGRRRPETAGDWELGRGSAQLLPEIIACLNRRNRRRQFAPEHRLCDFAPGGRWLGFKAENFLVARRRGRVIGALGRWDQRAFKQTRVAGYGPALGLLRPLLNAAAPWINGPRLPAPGSVLPHFYASFPTVDDDELPVFKALLRRLYNEAAGGEFHSFILGLHEADPLAAALDDYPRTRFAGRLFCVCYDAPSLDGRQPHVEAATL